MLEITGDEIKDIKKDDLRTLIARLCEADLIAMGLPPAGVTWGGDESAPDGGIDVTVDLSYQVNPDGFIPRSQTGFQVKAQDMPASRIDKEMRPKGKLQLSIKELASSGGAYVIVSSKGTISPPFLQKRIEAMQAALRDLPIPAELKIDFYDRVRVATWVNSHPAMILWVWERIGKPRRGWKAYGNWANCPGGIEEEYLLDEKVRFRPNSLLNENNMSSLDGIQAMRSALTKESASIRLTGLSGVGKTRLLQALFDERIGDNPLFKWDVFYTDLSDNPTPMPMGFLEELIAKGVKGILIIDNCPPDLHKKLTQLCSQDGCLIRLVTVEYDIVDDQPEDTEVFHMEPASKSFIQNLLQVRFPYLSTPNSQTIVHLSGGNSRVAIALAKTVKKGEDLSALNDQTIFNRLFLQRKSPDSSLLKVAEVCSLVYSFQFKSETEHPHELKLLSELTKIDPDQFFEKTTEIKKRDLIQERSIWRAVLPHAIANRLAKECLKNIRDFRIRQIFEQKGAERLLESFSKRLSYLHESEEARGIAAHWLSENGLLSDLTDLNQLKINLLKRIAPVTPELVLSSIEKAANSGNHAHFFSDNYYRYGLAKILCKLAYKKELFTRSVKLLCIFAIADKTASRPYSIRALLLPLFPALRSGTHATAEQKLSVIAGLFHSGNEEQVKLAIELLRSTLRCLSLNSVGDSEFGGHWRDSGYEPKGQELNQWFLLFLEFAGNLAISDYAYAPSVKKMIARHFNWLWRNFKMFDQLEQLALRIHEKGSWLDGWAAIRDTVRLKKDQIGDPGISRLKKLESHLAPKTPGDLARSFAYYPTEYFYNLSDNEGEKVYERFRNAGKEMVRDKELLEELLPEFLGTQGWGMGDIGQGMAEECQEPMNIWLIFCNYLNQIPSTKWNLNLLRGFLFKLSAIRYQDAERILDSVVKDENFKQVYPHLQSCVKIEQKGMERILVALDTDVALISEYGESRFEYVEIKDEDFCEVIRKITSKPQGGPVALKMMAQKIYNTENQSKKIGPTLIKLGVELLLKTNFSEGFADSSSNLKSIIKSCLGDDSQTEIGKIICQQIAINLESYWLSSTDANGVLEALAEKQPIALLDGFFKGRNSVSNEVALALTDSYGRNRGPLDLINDDVLLDWCGREPDIRFAILAGIITPFQFKNKEIGYEWTPLANQMITISPDPIAVLEKFRSSFTRKSSLGSWSASMSKRVGLLTSLKGHQKIEIAQWASKEEIEFRNWIEKEKAEEKKEDISRFQRFE